MLQKIYEQMADFYRNIEEEYGTVFGDHFDWEHFHFKFLIYYSRLKQEQDKRASKKVLQLGNTFLRCFLI